MIQQKLQDVTDGKIKRLMIQCPPRHGKSEVATIRYPVWSLLQDPAKRIIVGAYNATLAEKFSRRARSIARDCHLPLDDERTAVQEWMTKTGGGIKAVGVSGGVTGFGANLIVIDDPVKSREEAESKTYRENVWDWFRDDLYTRLEPGGAIILIMTRWHQGDLAGRLLEEMANGGESWEVVNLPALAEKADSLGRVPGEALCPERYDVKTLEGIRTVQGARSFNALYQQRPQPPEGNLFKSEWIESARIRKATVQEGTKTVPLFETMDRIVIPVDPAATSNAGSDETGIGAIGRRKDDFYIFFIKGFRLSPEGWARKAVEVYDEFRSDSVVAEQNNGGEMVRSVLQHVRPNLRVKLVHASRGKQTRAEPVATLFEQGRVHFVGVWAEAEDQLCSFPVSAEHDDLVDTIVWGITELTEKKGITGVQYIRL